MVNLYDLAPPPIPDLAKLWTEYGCPPSSLTTEREDKLDESTLAEKDVADKLDKVSLKDTTPITRLLALKLAIFKDIVLFCNHDGKEKLTEIMEDLQHDRVQKFAIDHRLKRALEGKEAANKKYAAGDRIGALYTYAIAWGLLLPYYPEVYAPGEVDGRDYRAEIGKAETTLFSNMAVMALTEAKNSDSAQDVKNALCQIGLDASDVCISMREFVTVNIMDKSCRRAIDLSERITSRKVPADKLRFYKEQAAKLHRIDKEKLFKDLGKEKQAKPFKV